MASLLSNQQQEIVKLAACGTSANALPPLTCSSSDHLAHHPHKNIISHDPMSRSLDASLAIISSYRTNHPANPYNPTADQSNRDAITSTHMGLKKSAPDNNHAKMVPFKWEEAPGKPIHTSSCNDLVPYNSSSLQLPPKLQCQSNQSPLHPIHNRSPLINPKTPAYNHDQSPPIAKKLPTPINKSLSRSSPNKEIIKRLCKYMLKTASCNGQTPLHKFISHSWHTPPSIEFSSCTTLHHHYKQQTDKLSFNDRFFFDRFSPKDLRHCASTDSILPVFDASDREDEFVSRKALSFLADEHIEEAESNSTNSSSPWRPLSFHERESSPYCPWQPAPITVYGELREGEGEGNDDDDDDEEGFHDFFSTSSSMKPSQRTDCDAMDSSCSSPLPWYLDFGPEQEEVHVEKRGSKLRVRLVALIKFKRVISRLKRTRETANHQGESTMWSPTLATYLYNQKEEERQKVSPPQSSPLLKQISGYGNSGELDDGRSEMGSNRLHIDSNYYLPSKIRTHVMNSEYYYNSDEESASSVRLGRRSSYHYCAEEAHVGIWRSPNYNSAEKEEEAAGSRQKLSLREQLAEFEEEEYPPPFGMHNESRAPSSPVSACKGMCKVRRTVKVLASTIKLFLVHSEIGKSKRAQRSSQGYINPTRGTHSTFPWSHK